MAATYQTEEIPTSVTDKPWIYESRQQNVLDNVYAIPEESGKWMMFYHVVEINYAWSRAKQLYRSGQLPNILNMKVSTAKPREHPPNRKVLIFYCGPASDKEKMLAIGRDLVQKMKYDRSHISYKTDVQTLAGIHGSTYKIRL